MRIRSLPTLLAALALLNPLAAMGKGPAGGKKGPPGHSESIDPPFPESRQQVTDKGRIHYLESGPPSAPAVVLVHGFPDAAAQWRPVVDALDERFHVFAVDLAGCGFSGRPDFVDYSVAGLAEYLGTFFEAAAIDRATVVGLDLAQPVVLRFAADHSKQVDRLVIGGAPVDPNAPLPALLGRLVASISGEAVAQRLTRELPDYLKGGVATPPGPDAALAAALAAPFDTAGGKKSLLAWVRSLPAEAWRLGERAASLVDVPVLVVWGAADPYLPVTQGAALAPMFRGARLVKLEEVGHFPVLERPSDLAAAILGFMPAAQAPIADAQVRLAGWQGDTLAGAFTVRSERKKRVRVALSVAPFERVGAPVVLPGRQPVPLAGPEAVQLTVAGKPWTPEDKLTLEAGKPPIAVEFRVPLSARNFQFGERYRLVLTLTPDPRDARDLVVPPVVLGFQVLRLEDDRPAGLQGDPEVPPFEVVLQDPPPPVPGSPPPTAPVPR